MASLASSSAKPMYLRRIDKEKGKWRTSPIEGITLVESEGLDWVVKMEGANSIPAFVAPGLNYLPGRGEFT